MADNRPANPKVNDVCVTDAGTLEYYNGTTWVAYLSPPETVPGATFQPGLLEEATPDESDGESDGGSDETSGDS